VKFLVVWFRVVIYFSGSRMLARRPRLSFRRGISLEQPLRSFFVRSLHHFLMDGIDLFSKRMIIGSVLVSPNFSSRIELHRFHVLKLLRFINRILSLLVSISG